LASKLRKVQKTLLRHPQLNPNQPVSKDGEIPLIVSAKLGDWEAFRALEERSVKISSGPVDQAGNTMLHLLIGKHAPEDLIENTLAAVTDTDLNALNNEGLTPLMVAIREKNWALVRELLSLTGIEITRHGDKNQSALMLALEMKADQDTLNKFVEVNPSLLTEPDYFGWTPLHRAVSSQQLDWIKWLTAEPGSSATLWEQVDRLGRRPVDLASPFLRETLSLSEETIAWPRPKSWGSDLKWKPVDAVKRKGLLELIAPMNERYAIDEDTEIHTATLSFYDPKKVRIVRVKSSAWNHTVYYLKHKKNLYRLNGTSPPIHQINSTAQISLNVDNVLDYLRFFCFFVRGEEGPFLIAESPEQAEIPSTLNETEQADLLKVLRPACLNGYDEVKTEFLAMATVYYSDAVFIADFAIKRTGMVEMISDQTVLGDLSAKVSNPLVV
jgi:hypothetical protein